MGNYWEAILSNGDVIREYQLPEAPSAWQNLASLIKEKSLRITGLRLYIGGRICEQPFNKRGYFQSKQLRSVAGRDNSLAIGVGFLQEKKDVVRIIWCQENGSSCVEFRSISKNDPAVIINRDFKG